MKRKRKREKIVCILVYICLNNIEKSDTSGLSLLPQKREGRRNEWADKWNKSTTRLRRKHSRDN